MEYPRIAVQSIAYEFPSQAIDPVVPRSFLDSSTSTLRCAGISMNIVSLGSGLVCKE